METVDIVARGIGALGVIMAGIGIGVTWYLWNRSGPQLKVTAFVSSTTGTVRIEVAGVGRLPATVRRIELRDELPLRKSGGGSSEYEPLSRWSVPATTAMALPIDVAPSGFLVADVHIEAILDGSRGASGEVSVRAWVERGDGKWHTSDLIRVR